MKKSAKAPAAPPDQGVTPDLFRALELAHYAARFRGNTFVIGITADTPFENLQLDLKVLAGYRIRVVLVLSDPSHELEELIARSNRHGTNFHLSLLAPLPLDEGAPTLGRHGAPTLGNDRAYALEDEIAPILGKHGVAGLRDLLAEEKIPIVAFHPQAREIDGVHITFALAAQVALRLGAHKLFLSSPKLAPLIAASPRAHVRPGEIAALRDRLPPANEKIFAPLLEFVGGQLECGIPDIILIDDKPGQLFQEVFTPEGVGMLFNRVEREVVRQARMEDVTDIGLLLRAEIEEGRILPMDENGIERDIHLYWVYEIDGLIVGSCRLKTFGDSAEVAQFTTLPRYRGKGHARTLGNRLEREAANLGIRKLFALSIFEGMWRFLESQGFNPVDRESLPRQWQAGYDMSRPSKAYLKEL